MTRSRRQPPDWTGPTKPTAGVPVHGGPEVKTVVFETTAQQDSTSAMKVLAQFQARTVGHLEKVDVGAIVSAYLEEHQDVLYSDEGYQSGRDITHDGQDEPCSSCMAKCAPGERVARDVLALTALVETVLDQARAVLRTRLAIDIATSILPRMEGTK